MIINLSKRSTPLLRVVGIITIAATVIFYLTGCEKQRASDESGTKKNTEMVGNNGVEDRIIKGSQRDVLIDRGISLRILQIKSYATDFTGMPRTSVKFNFEAVGDEVPFGKVTTLAYLGSALVGVTVGQFVGFKNPDGTFDFAFHVQRGEIGMGEQVIATEPEEFDRKGAVLIKKGQKFDTPPLVDVEKEKMCDRVEILLERPGQGSSKFIFDMSSVD